jgi:exonuclease III
LDWRAGAVRAADGALCIDPTVASAELAARRKGPPIDRSTRSGERLSDHAPVLASFDI